MSFWRNAKKVEMLGGGGGDFKSASAAVAISRSRNVFSSNVKRRNVISANVPKGRKGFYRNVILTKYEKSKRYFCDVIKSKC